MKRTKKRILAVLLSLAMVLSFSAPALAFLAPDYDPAEELRTQLLAELESMLQDMVLDAFNPDDFDDDDGLNEDELNEDEINEDELGEDELAEDELNGDDLNNDDEVIEEEEAPLAAIAPMNALIMPMNAEHPDFNRDALRVIVAGQINSTIGAGADALLNNDAIKDFAKDAVKTVLNPSLLAGTAGPALGGLIQGAIEGALGIDIPESISIGDIIGDVLGNDFVMGILTHRIVESIIDKTIDNLFDEIDLMPFADLVFDAMIDRFTDEIWRNGNPTTGTFGHWSEGTPDRVVLGITIPGTPAGWNTLTIGGYLVVNGIVGLWNAISSGDFSGLVDIDDISLEDLLAIFDLNVVLDAVVNAVIDTVREEIETFLAPYIDALRNAIVEAIEAINDAIDAAVAAAHRLVINGLNDIFDAGLTMDMTLEEIIGTLNPIIDQIVFEDEGVAIRRLTSLQGIAGRVGLDDLANFIGSIIDRLESREGRHGEILSRTVNITFTGVEGVTVQYYTSTTNWVTVGVYDNEASFVIPTEALGANGYYAVRALKSGMSYQVSNITLVSGQTVNVDVPVKPITVTGVSSVCNLGIVQSNWVYDMAPAIVGESNVFNVFDNGREYELRVGRAGYHNITGIMTEAGGNVWLDVFYNIAIPEGVTNVRISNANWVDTTVWYANYLESDVITLMKNNSPAWLTFTHEGTTYSRMPFVLDGNSPFDPLIIRTEATCTTDGYTIEWYVATGWRGNQVIHTAALGHDFGITSHNDFDNSQSRFADVSDRLMDPWHTCQTCGWGGYIYSFTSAEIFVATCTTNGLVEYTATLIPHSGMSSDWNYILGVWSDPLGHTPGAEANCTEDQVCEVCDEVLVEALGHKPGEPVSTATCWTGGWITSFCTECGDVVATHGWEGALGHDLDLVNYTVSESNPNGLFGRPDLPRWGYANCLREGCDHVATINLWFATVVEPTCTADGYTIWEYWPTGWIGHQGNWVPALKHVFGDFWDMDFTQSRLPHLTNANDPVGTCTRDGCGWSGYVFHWQIDEFEPTCTTGGRVSYVATVLPNMGFDFEPWATERYTDDALGHDFQSIVWDGHGWWYSECIRCNWAGYLSYDPCLFECDWQVVTTPPTCSLQGHTTNVCANGCGNVWGFWWDYTDALGHDFQTIAWDGHGWLASDCTRCDWRGYVSFELQRIAITGGRPAANMSIDAILNPNLVVTAYYEYEGKEYRDTVTDYTVTLNGEEITFPYTLNERGNQTFVVTFEGEEDSFTVRVRPDDADKEILRGMVEGNTQLLGFLGGAIGDMLAPLITGMISDFLNPAELVGMAGPALAGLIEGAIRDMGIELPSSISVEEIIDDVLNSGIVQGILGSDFLAKVIDGVIVALIAEVSMDALIPAVMASAIDGITEAIWNNGRPGTVTFTLFGFPVTQNLWNTTGNNAWTWNALGVSTYALANFANHINLDGIDFLDLLPDMDVLLNILLSVVTEVAKETYEEYRAVIEGLIREKIQAVKDAAITWIIAELNKILPIAISVYDSYQEIMAKVEAAIELYNMTKEQVEEIIDRLIALHDVVQNLPIDAYKDQALSIINAVIAKLIECKNNKFKDDDDDPDPVFFTVTFDDGDGNILEELTQVVAQNGLVEQPADLAAREGYDFGGWHYIFEDNDFPFNFEEMRANSDFTITAKWTEIMFGVSFRTEHGIFESNNDDNLGWQNIGWFREFVIPTEIPVREGYKFTGWLSEANVVPAEGMTYAQLVAGNNTMTSVSVWAQWAAVLTYIELDFSAVKTNYLIRENIPANAGLSETLDLTGLVVTAFYGDDTSKTVTDFTTDLTESTMLRLSNTSVTVEYVDDGVSKTASFPITVRLHVSELETLTELVYNALSSSATIMNFIMGGSFIEDMINDAIGEFLDLELLLEMAGPLLGGVIKDALLGIGIPVPDSIDIEGIVNGIFANDIVNGIVTSEFVGAVFARVIEKVLAELDFDALMEPVLRSIAKNIAIVIFNDGNPALGTGNAFDAGVWNDSTNRWIPHRVVLGLELPTAGVALTVLTNMLSNINNLLNYINLEDLDFMAMLPDLDVLLAAAIAGVTEVVMEYYEKYRQQILDYIKGLIDGAIDAGMKWIVDTLNSEFPALNLNYDMNPEDILARIATVLYGDLQDVLAAFRIEANEVGQDEIRYDLTFLYDSSNQYANTVIPAVLRLLELTGNAPEFSIQSASGGNFEIVGGQLVEKAEGNAPGTYNVRVLYTFEFRGTTYRLASATVVVVIEEQKCCEDYPDCICDDKLPPCDCGDCDECNPPCDCGVCEECDPGTGDCTCGVCEECDPGTGCGYCWDCDDCEILDAAIKALEALIRSVQELDEALYTPATWAILQEALAAAFAELYNLHEKGIYTSELLDLENAEPQFIALLSQDLADLIDKINDAAKNLQDAKDGLEPVTGGVVECDCDEHEEKIDTFLSTCAIQGSTVYSCANCGDVKSSTILPLIAHVPGESVTVDATCTVDGSTTISCIFCETEIDSTTIPAAHTWGAGVETTAPTTSAPGVRTFTCTVCQATRTEAIDQLSTGGFGGGGGGGGGGAIIQNIIDAETPLAGIFAGFITGYADDTFRGGQPMTREEFVTILFRLFGNYVDVDDATFNDVAEDRWSFDMIEWANAEGIIEADEDGNFRPRDNLTRAEMAVMLARAENLTEMAENTFSDLEGHAAADDILKAVEAGIFEGYQDGTFRPNATTNRYEVVTALVRFLLGDEPTDEMWENVILRFTDVSTGHWAYKYVVLSANGYLPLPTAQDPAA